MKKISLLILFLSTTTVLFSQKITIEEYIQTYKDIAIQEMIRTGVPASITIAQGIVETENGNSKLVKKSNNHFGIKCKETWTGPSVSHDDDAPGECFRKYNDAIESYIDHSNFLRTRKHYNFLFDLDPLDYKAWAYGLKKAGYATNPQYPALLIKYIETYNLNEYSLIAVNQKKTGEPVQSVVKNEPVVVPPAVSEKKEPVAETVKKAPVKKDPGSETVKKEPVQKETKPKDQPVVLPAAQQQEVVVVKTEEKKQAQQVQRKPAVNYPAGEFRINETRVVYVKAGTSFLSIAQQYNVPLKYLFDFNDLSEKETLEQDQLIFLQRKRRTGANTFHVVAEGETLYDIAQTEAIRLEALLQLNLLTGKQQPAVGEQLHLQTAAPVAPRLRAQGAAVTSAPETVPGDHTAGQEEIVIHIVQPKETLYSISRKYQVSVTDIQHWNQLTGAELKEGVELIINKKQNGNNQGSR